MFPVIFVAPSPVQVRGTTLGLWPVLCHQPYADACYEILDGHSGHAKGQAASADGRLKDRMAPIEPIGPNRKNLIDSTNQ